ncbi:Chondroitin proteoglycan 2 [Penaeus vannamei]|uniref:Chondroitin proteoglycan 2 n=1 Tax=Penaeus vannamei TaxID=6689 RepID=A0A3R7PJY3_PENVA|nr:Chondroitin proteoglycan 2 [Penaeus vannamei]
MPCAPGTVWNQQKLTCDHEWASPCVTGSYLTPEGLPCGGGSGGNGSGDGGDKGNGGGDEGNGGGDEGNEETEMETKETEVETKETEVETMVTEVEIVEMKERVKTEVGIVEMAKESCGTCNEGGNGGGDGSIDGCVIDCSLGKYLPHPTDCRKFIQCAPYGPEEMPCAPGTVWNQQKLTCDHEWASPCVTGSYLTSEGLPCGGGSGGNGSGDGGDEGNGGGDEGNEVETKETEVETKETEVETMVTEVEIVEMKERVKTEVGIVGMAKESCGTCNEGGNGGGDGSIDGCVIDCSLGKYLPHPTDCRKFIQCAPYGPEEMPCAPGTVWNQQKLTCDHEWASPCVTGSYLTPEEPPNVKPDICDCECCLRPHPEDCTAYYYCEPNASAKFHTCSEGLVFNPEFSQCVLQVDYPQCQPEKPPTCDPTCQCLYPAHSCSEYYKCNGDGIPVKYECTGGLYFNDQKHTCDLPENVSCEERRKRSEIDPVTEQHYILPEECKDLQGMYAIRDRPSSYYLCGHGVAFEMRCPDGGVFSSKAQTCILRK